MRNLLKTKLFYICLVLILTPAFILSTIAAAKAQEPIYETLPVYQVNENGLTYGSGASAYSFESEPDLIRAMGDDGIIGYVYAIDLRGPIPNTPEEALAIMQMQGTKLRSIPLYASDGQTVLGEFFVGGGERTEYYESISE